MSLIRNLSIVCSLLVTGSIVRADGTSNDDIAKFLKFFDQVVAAITTDKDDCVKMAKDINALVDTNQAVIDAAKKAQQSGQHLPQDAVNHMMDSAKKMGMAMQKCSKDKGVMDALARFPHGPPQQHK